jgi:hypothetical protein
MSRALLPQRRRCETLCYRIGNLTYQGSVGYYDDGRPGEVFLDCSKSGTDVQVAARDSAILASFALQYGASINSLRSALTRSPDGRAEGPLGALLDLLAGERQ